MLSRIDKDYQTVFKNTKLKIYSVHICKICKIERLQVNRWKEICLLQGSQFDVITSDKIDVRTEKFKEFLLEVTGDTL